MNKLKRFLSFLMILFLIVVVSITFISVSAKENRQELSPVSRGAQIYDDWTKVIPDAPVPVGNNPVWSRQTNNTRSGLDTWRCVECHGWDYQGNTGAFRSGSNFTGFPGILETAGYNRGELVAALDGSSDAQHNFTSMLSEDDVDSVIAFIQTGLINDNEYIDLVTRKVIGGDLNNGKQKYGQACSSCHGEDGTMATFRYEGTEVALGTLAIQDPWRFLHRTRFGTARAPEMPLGYEVGWTPEDGRDVVYYVQSSLPTGFEVMENQPVDVEPIVNLGGPAQNWFSGIVTAFGAMATSLGFAILLGAFFVGIILLLVWLLRNRQAK
jgi:thiosulfate dehydrogenase